METIRIDSIRPNPHNPRVIRDKAFQALVDSIKAHPEFLEKRGIVHANGVILGGNMRFRAIQEAMKDPDFREKVGVSSQHEIPAAWVKDASEFSEEQRRIFAILDNAPPGLSGAWDWDLLANEWSDLPLPEWDLIPIEWGETSTDRDEQKWASPWKRVGRESETASQSVRFVFGDIEANIPFEHYETMKTKLEAMFEAGRSFTDSIILAINAEWEMPQ